MARKKSQNKNNTSSQGPPSLGLGGVFLGYRNESAIMRRATWGGRTVQNALLNHLFGFRALGKLLLRANVSSKAVGADSFGGGGYS